ncbi:MAG: YidC/Oxa1 family insertase periplasmic-domain containing protein [Candidatus Omnitrophica bacterium]|nr:YidC/Oxa1 family insertase periplasmic-domain containing protein [Candidatus Omnitrophota bacterium]
MKAEQRLLLALSLTLGVLLLWTFLLPPTQEQPAPPQPQPREAIQPETAALPPTPLSVGEFAVGQIHLGVEETTGALRLLGTDGIQLLDQRHPGLLRVEGIQPHTLPRFETLPAGQGLVSEANLEPQGLKIRRELFQSDEIHKNLLDCKLQIINNSEKSQKFPLRVSLYEPLGALELDRQFLAGFVSAEGKRRGIKARAGQSLQFPGPPQWISSQGKSYAVIAHRIPPAGMFHVEHSMEGRVSGWLTLPGEEIPPGEKREWTFRLYVGPISLAALQGTGLEEVISFGAFSWVAKLLLELMTWAYGWTHNYGASILLISLAIWILFFPLTWSGVRMMKVMSQIQPQVERIRREHQKNPQKMNQEILELYRKNRVNPLSGCLPLFLQMPIFIALYQVLSRSPELRGAGFLWIKDLSAPDAMIRFPSEVPLIGRSLNFLPLLMSAAMFFQQRLTTSANAAITEEQRIQQSIFKWFPLLFGFMFYSLPSGLVLYWVSNTALTLTQQLFAKRL